MPSPAEILLNWYDRHGRDLPWRVKSGPADPYRVWLSEIMLQQTTVATVKAYFAKFTARWPQVEDLAAAELDEVLAAWAGLGYYARARNLHACAQKVADEMGGRFPDTVEGLKALPGIGDYTAAAVAAIAFDRPAVVLDGNIERVMARLHRVATALPAAKPVLKQHAADWTPDHRPGDYAQAVMDLGATICTPTKPKCLLCPWSDPCAARRAGDAERYPVKPPKKRKPTRRAVMFWLEAEGAVLLRRRDEKGLLGGMLEVPSTPWTDGVFTAEDPMHLAYRPVELDFEPCPGIVRHTFTHFHFEISVRRAKAEKKPPTQGLWVPLDQLDQVALPTVMAKVARHARLKDGVI